MQIQFMIVPIVQIRPRLWIPDCSVLMIEAKWKSFKFDERMRSMRRWAFPTVKAELEQTIQ